MVREELDRSDNRESSIFFINSAPKEGYIYTIWILEKNVKVVKIIDKKKIVLFIQNILRNFVLFADYLVNMNSVFLFKNERRINS